jgi:branched-chain amino acid transport system substrate-binding protein
MAYKKAYETKYGEDVSTFGGHAYDALTLLARAIREAGDNREKVRSSLENIRNFIGTAGVFNFSPTDHNGLDLDAFAMLTVKDGRFVLLDK